MAAVIAFLTAPFWAWAVLVEYREYPGLALKTLLTVLLFGGIIYFSWRRLLTGRWRVLGLGAITASIFGALASLVPQYFPSSLGWEPLLPRTTFFDLCYLAAATAFGLFWIGLVGTTRVPASLRWVNGVTGAAIRYLLPWPFLLFAHNNFGLLEDSWVQVTVLTMLCAIVLGIIALLGTALITFKRARACSGLICLCVLQSFVPGCFSTLYWEEFQERRMPDRLEGASVEGDTRLALTVKYRSGKTRRVEADLPRGPNPYPKQRYMFVARSKLTEREHPQSSRAIPLVQSAAEGDGQEWFGLASASTGMAYVHHGEDRFEIYLPRPAPVDWRSAGTYVGLLLLPAPVLLDVVTFPGQLIAFTMDPDGFQRLMTRHPAP